MCVSRSMICDRCRALCRMNKEKSSKETVTVRRMSPRSLLTSCFRGQLIVFTESDVADAVTYSVIFVLIEWCTH